MNWIEKFTVCIERFSKGFSNTKNNWSCNILKDWKEKQGCIFVTIIIFSFWIWDKGYKPFKKLFIIFGLFFLKKQEIYHDWSCKTENKRIWNISWIKICPNNEIITNLDIKFPIGLLTTIASYAAVNATIFFQKKKK